VWSRYLFKAELIATIVVIITVTISVATAMSTGSSPNMSEIEKADKAQRNLFIVYILFLTLTVVFAVLVWWSGNKYQDAVKRDADSKIESSKAEVAKAKESIADLAVQADEEKLKILKMEKEVADARKGQAEAQRALLELQESLKPRHLTNKQRLQLIEALAKHPAGDITISCMGSSGESCNFAAELRGLLKTCDWKTKDGGVVVAVSGEQQPSGVVISVQSRNSLSAKLAGILLTELNKMGFNAKGVTKDSLSQDEIDVLIGLKPETSFISN
jgi:hypothetical protein